jgi:DNA-binding transcriptional LysR family regulator
MDVTNKTSVIKNLENNEVDFALVSVLPKHLNVNRVELMENILYLVGSSSKKELKGKAGLASLDKAKLLFRENGSATRMAMENYLSSKKIKVSKKIELTSNEAVKQAIVAGLGYSVMPLIGLKNELINESLKICKLPGLPIKTNWNLIWMNSKKFSPVANTFLNYIEEEKEKIIEHEFDWFTQYRKEK